MPIYEYECEKCGDRFECKQGINDAPLTKCTKCKGKVKRIIHPSPFFFKAKTYPGDPSIQQAPEGHWMKEEK